MTTKNHQAIETFRAILDQEVTDQRIVVVLVGFVLIHTKVQRHPHPNRQGIYYFDNGSVAQGYFHYSHIQSVNVEISKTGEPLVTIRVNGHQFDVTKVNTRTYG